MKFSFSISFLAFLLLASRSSEAKEGKRIWTTYEVFSELLEANRMQVSEGLLQTQWGRFSNTVQELKAKKKKLKSTRRFLAHVFYKIHNQYLKEYTPFQSFQLLLENGEYGCLTATALYALLFSELGYEVEIRETNYHVFLLVHAEKHRFLIETTDPANGFVWQAEEVESRLSHNLKVGQRSESDYQLRCKVNRAIKLRELVGLQYYNVAVGYHNKGNSELALYFLLKARRTYCSSRLKEFFNLVVSTRNHSFAGFPLQSK